MMDKLKEKFRINNNLKILILFILLFLAFPMSVSAGRNDQMKEDPEKNIISRDTDKKDVNDRLKEYTSFVSDGSFGGSGAYSALDAVDENSINGFAVMIDTATGGRGGVRDGVECVEEYQGYYYYDIKLTVPGETDFGRIGYSRRTYYKYVQLKKEDRTFNNGSTLIFDGASTGIWLYYSSDQVADQTRQIQTELGLIDVFTGESMSSETRPYWEEMFMWPLSSKGVGVASDTGDIVSAICNHDPTSYESISKDNAFCLAFFQRRNTRRSPSYMNYNTKYGCTYDVAVPSYTTLIAKIVAVTGHDKYYNYPQGAWYYQTSGQAGLKNWVVTNGVMTRMDVRYTYSDHNGKTWPTYFLYNSADGLRYNTSTGYSYMLEEIGGQSELLHGIDSDIFGSYPFKNYTTHRNPNTHTFITNGFVNASWVNATNDGSNLDNAPREILRTLQVFLKSHEGAFNKFIGYVNKEESSYNHKCYYGLCNSSNLSMTNFNNAVATGNSQLALDMLTTLYEAGRKYSEWYDYASDGLATKIGVAHGGWYNHYSSGILAGEPSPTADTVLMGDGNKLQIVDLFKAFGVSDSKAYDFIEEYRKNPYNKNLSIPGLNSEKTKMIINALNNTDNSTIVLTNAEISKGKVDMSDDQTELYTGYIPYVAVLTKSNVNSFKGYGTEGSDPYIPPYNGKNASEIVDIFYDLALNDNMTLETISKSSGVALFENIFNDETIYSDCKATFLFVFSKNKITGSSEEILTYQDFEKLNYGANIGAMADSIKAKLFTRELGILSSDTKYGDYAETITVKSTQKAEDVMKYCTAEGYSKDTITRNQDSMKFFATFCIDAYCPELKNGSLYRNQRESLEVYKGPLKIMPSSIYLTNIANATKNHTKSVSIFAANASVKHSENYILGESLSKNIASANLGTFSSIFNTIVNGTYVDNLGYTRTIYGDFISNAKKVKIEISSYEVANFGYTRDDDGVVTFYLTQAQLNDLNTQLKNYTLSCIRNGYLKGLTETEFNNIKDYVTSPTAQSNVLFVNWLGIVFDRNSVCAAYGYVPETPEDLVVSDSTNNIDKTNSNGSSNSECRETIDWFTGKANDYFDVTVLWTKKGTSALDDKIITMHTVKNDLSPKNIYDKLALFPKNYELTNPVDATKINGTVTVGRVPEAQLKGLKIGDYKLIMFEEFFVNEDEFGTKSDSFNSIGTKLSAWYYGSNPETYGKTFYNLVTDAYATDILFKKWNSNSNILTNMTLKVVSYQAPQGEIKVLRNQVISDLTLGTPITTNIENTEWTPGMVVNYEYTYNLPYGSEKTTTEYISNRAGTQYNNNYVNTNNYTGLRVINDALIRFALVPKTNSAGNTVRYNGTVSSAAMGYDRNTYNNETSIYADIPDGGNMQWYDDESIYVQLKANGKTWGQLIEYSDDDVYTRTIKIPENALTELGCLDDSGNLTSQLVVTIQPVLRYDNFVYGQYAKSYHSTSQMEINIDNRITASNADLKLSTLKVITQSINQDQDNVSAYGTYNSSMKSASNTIGNTKLSSTHMLQLNVDITFNKGVAVTGAEHVNTVAVTVPGTEISDCSSKNSPRCKSDNTIADDWETIYITFDGNLPHDNVVKDIIVFDNEDKNKEVLGVDNYGQTAGTQSLVSSDTEKWLSNELGIYAIVERTEQNKASMPECTVNNIENVEIGHFELSYTANGVDYTQSTSCIATSGEGTYNKYKGVDILSKVGDKLIFEHYINTVYPISELTVKFEYRTCTDTTLSYDNDDTNMANNVRTESWDSGIDVTVEVTSVPNKITKQGQYACKLDEDGNVVSGAETITGTLETFSFEAKATITALLANTDAKDVVDDLDMKYTLFVYAEHNGKKYYPVSVSGEGITGSYYNGKAHMLLSRLGEYDVVAEWEDVALGEGQVKIQFEVWPVPSLDSSYKIIYQNFPNIPTSQYSKDIFDKNNPSVFETDPYREGTISSNNKNSKTFNVSATYKNCELACTKNDDFLANEVRWTVRFKWTNYQNGIADWTSIKESDEWYKYSSSLTNINYEFNEVLNSYHSEKKINTYSWMGFSQRYSSGWTLRKYGGGIYKGVDLTRKTGQIYYVRSEAITKTTTQLIKFDLFGKQYKVNWYTGITNEYEGYRTITGYRYYDVNTCKHEKGPDQNEYNWGPNGLTGNSYSTDYSKFVSGYYLPDETGARTGNVTAVSKFNKTTIPTKYWNYMYKGGTMAGVTAPKTNNNDSIHNWDSLSSTSYYDSTYAGGLKYHFYSEKVTASVQVASSRDNFVWHDPSSWTVYNGESFKVRGKIVYEINTYGNYPRSPVQDYEVSSSYTNKLFTKYYEKGQGGYDSKGYFIYTEKVVNGKVDKSVKQKIYIAVFDSTSNKVVNGVGTYTKAWKNSGNSAWSPDVKTVDYYNGPMKSHYAGQRIYGAYEVASNGYWKSINAKYNLFRFLVNNYGLKNYQTGVSQECNYLSVTYLPGIKPTIYAEYKIYGTSSFNKFVVRLPDSKTATNSKTTAYWNILPGYNSSQDAITVPLTNVSQDIKIQFNAFPFAGAGRTSTFKYHPYLGANDEQHDNRYLCDTSSYTIKIRPTGNIIGDVSDDDDTNVEGDGGWKDGEESGGSAGVY